MSPDNTSSPYNTASADNTPKTSHEKALARCDEHIKFYEDGKLWQRIAFQSFQVAAIVLSGITPILLLLLPDTQSNWAALPALLAAISVGLLGIFQWKENYSRFAYTCEALKSERIKFETRTTKEYDRQLDDHVALTNFVERVEAIAMSEVTDWRGLMQEATKVGDQAQGTLTNSSAPPPPVTQQGPRKQLTRS